MAVSEESDFFKRCVGFLESLNRVLAEGFLEMFEAGMTADQKSTSIRIRAMGKIPHSRESLGVGIKPYLDVAQVIETIRTQFNSEDVALELVTCKVQTQDWNKWDETGNICLGKLGVVVTLELVIMVSQNSPKSS